MGTRWQGIFLFLLPFCLTAALLAVTLTARPWRESLRQERVREQWLTHARGALSHLAAGHSLEGRFELLAFAMNERWREELARRTPPPPLPATGVRPAVPGGTRERELETRLRNTFRRVFTPRFRPPGSSILGFVQEADGQVRFLPGAVVGSPPGAGRARIMAGLLEGFLAHDAGKTLPAAREESLKARCRGVFGTHISPRFMGTERRGRLTPVVMNRKRGYVQWNLLPGRSRRRAGYLALFPATLPWHVRARASCLELVARESRGAMVPLLVPIHSALPPRRALVHPAARRIPGLRRLLAEVVRRPDREAVFPHGQVLTTPDFWALRGFVSHDIPYEGWIVSRPPFRPTGRDLPAGLAWGFFLAAWGVVALAAGWRGAFPALSIRVTFPLLFFLLAAIPLAIMFQLGSYQIDSWRMRTIQEMGRATLDEIGQVNNEMSDVVFGFSLCGQALMNGSWPARLASSDPVVEAAAASEALRFFREKTPYGLDMILVFKPGTPAHGYLRDPALHQSMQAGLDLFAPMARAVIARSELDRSEEEIFPLTERQKGFQRAFKEGASVLSAGLKGTTEAGQIVQVTGSHRFLSFSQTIQEKGRERVFFFLLVRADHAFARHLTTRIAQRNLDGRDHQYALAWRHGGAAQELTPPPGAPLWRTRRGLGLRRIISRSAMLSSPLVWESSSHLRVARHCPKLGDFLIGVDLDLGPVQAATLLQRRALTGGILLLLVIALIMGHFTARFLILPVVAVEVGMRELVHERFPPPLALDRQDELGEMTHAFDAMVQGLKERVKLGRFVSGTLEHSLEGAADTAALHQEGTVLPAVVLASDLRSFTTLSERFPPGEVVEMLNQHLETMSAAIRARGGQIDKFIGDAIIAVFRGPAAAAAAVDAALAMRASHDRLQAERLAAGRFPYEMGVGIDAGEVFLGTIATRDRAEFTVLGPPRERAENLEAASKKGRATRVMVSDAVRDEVAGRFAFIPHRPDVHELAGPVAPPAAPEAAP
ncbi:MAG: adenylate/guanylate cyclase domain-containing protein [Candidatus Riflebacteria bacterium]|nr:adenylate/guanylate cyclase domain-containing protein [Candidatus Riflebacteria bacterium]